VSFVEGLPPVAATGCRVLLVGSMPGVASLRAAQYYGHPRNAFWPILATLTGVAATAPYAERLAGLGRVGIALWDVLQRCERPGSLDADIRRRGRRANDFAGLFVAQPELALVGCNGAKAHQLWLGLVQPVLPAAAARLPVVRLPSTSPAHAGASFARKLAAWRAALQPLLPCVSH
jgi:hypoxanthine-DNA glycosylase